MLTIGLKVELLKQKETIRESQNSILHCKEYFENKTYIDFMLICSDGTEIAVHRYFYYFVWNLAHYETCVQY
jgi:hypothetical protein